MISLATLFGSQLVEFLSPTSSRNQFANFRKDARIYFSGLVGGKTASGGGLLSENLLVRRKLLKAVEEAVALNALACLPISIENKYACPVADFPCPVRRPEAGGNDAISNKGLFGLDASQQCPGCGLSFATGKHTCEQDSVMESMDSSGDDGACHNDDGTTIVRVDEDTKTRGHRHFGGEICKGLGLLTGTMCTTIGIIFSLILVAAGGIMLAVGLTGGGAILGILFIAGIILLTVGLLLFLISLIASIVMLVKMKKWADCSRQEAVRECKRKKRHKKCFHAVQKDPRVCAGDSATCCILVPKNGVNDSPKIGVTAGEMGATQIRAGQMTGWKRRDRAAIQAPNALQPSCGSRRNILQGPSWRSVFCAALTSACFIAVGTVALVSAVLVLIFGLNRIAPAEWHNRFPSVRSFAFVIAAIGGLLILSGSYIGFVAWKWLKGEDDTSARLGQTGLSMFDRRKELFFKTCPASDDMYLNQENNTDPLCTASCTGQTPEIGGLGSIDGEDYLRATPAQCTNNHSKEQNICYASDAAASSANLSPAI
ncbi:unnamed protein product [Notodromas monacha]|uniref:Uncharacterized protein n=1 Tax=Notodromas monacha TaxID=399045 RepID=A0A7R9BJU8_9CRUS|nr:unnamed protein product [Notodromas monacha]CAG0916839.1 unnamed protein product [Notodromas monacha]